MDQDPKVFALELRKSIGLLTEEEIAAALQLQSVGTLATWRSQDIGPPSVKLGKKVFYTANGFQNWINAKIQQQEAAATAEKAAA